MPRHLKRLTVSLFLILAFALVTPSGVTLLGVTLPSALTPAHAANETVGDWVVSCDASAGAAERCVISQRQTLTSSDGKTGRLLDMVLSRREDGLLVLQALLPLGLHIPSGAAIKLDEQPHVPMTLQRCTASGCEAAMLLPKALEASLKTAKSARVGFNAGDRTVTIPVGLKGLVTALGRLK